MYTAASGMSSLRILASSRTLESVSEGLGRVLGYIWDICIAVPVDSVSLPWMGAGFAYVAIGTMPGGVTPRASPPFALATAASYFSVAVSGESSLSSTPTIKGLSECASGFGNRQQTLPLQDPETKSGLPLGAPKAVVWKLQNSPRTACTRRRTLRKTFKLLVGLFVSTRTLPKRCARS